MLELSNQKFATPADEIRARVRSLGGKPGFGEGQLAMERAYRALAPLPGLTKRKFRSYWHGSVTSVPSHHMDRARSLTMAANENWGRLPCADFPRRVIATARAIIARAPSGRPPRLGGAFC